MRSSAAQAPLSFPLGSADRRPALSCSGTGSLRPFPTLTPHAAPALPRRCPDAAPVSPRAAIGLFKCGGAMPPGSHRAATGASPTGHRTPFPSWYRSPTLSRSWPSPLPRSVTGVGRADLGSGEAAWGQRVWLPRRATLPRHRPTRPLHCSSTRPSSPCTTMKAADAHRMYSHGLLDAANGDRYVGCRPQGPLVVS